MENAVGQDTKQFVKTPFTELSFFPQIELVQWVNRFVWKSWYNQIQKTTIASSKRVDKEIKTYFSS